MPAEDDRAAGDDVPGLHRSVTATREDTSAVGVERQGEHAIRMAVERGQRVAGGYLTEPDAIVPTDRGELRALPVEGDPLHEAPVAQDRLCRGAGGQVPELDRVVPAAAGQVLAVGMEGDAVDPLGMADQGWLDHGPRIDIPHLDALQAGQGETAPVVVEGHGVNP